jgi:hypothetical protein
MARLVVAGAFTGLALFGATVLALGGAGRRVVIGFWIAGVVLVAVRDFGKARLGRGVGQRRWS